MDGWADKHVYDSLVTHRLCKRSSFPLLCSTVIPNLVICQNKLLSQSIVMHGIG